MLQAQQHARVLFHELLCDRPNFFSRSSLMVLFATHKGLALIKVENASSLCLLFPSFNYISLLCNSLSTYGFTSCRKGSCKVSTSFLYPKTCIVTFVPPRTPPKRGHRGRGGRNSAKSRDIIER